MDNHFSAAGSLNGPAGNEREVLLFAGGIEIFVVLGSRWVCDTTQTVEQPSSRSCERKPAPRERKRSRAFPAGEPAFFVAKQKLSSLRFGRHEHKSERPPAPGSQGPRDGG